MARANPTAAMQAKALEARLRRLFRSVAVRPVPATLLAIVDQLEAAVGAREAV